MNLQIIKSVTGKDEYVLLPIALYRSLRPEISSKLRAMPQDNEYVPFDPADYVDSPIALARIKAGLTQEQLAKRMKVTQAYMSKLENQKSVTAKTLYKVRQALEKKNK